MGFIYRMIGFKSDRMWLFLNLFYFYIVQIDKIELHYHSS